MPSPVGHALAGVAVAWSADLVPRGGARPAVPAGASWYEKAGNGLTAACVILAAIPDIDLLTAAHRTWSHSITAVAVVAAIAAIAAARAGWPVARVTAVCASAYASHLLMDWLGVDTSPPEGIQLLWPFGHAYFISGWDLFRGTEREDVLSARAIWINALALAQEIALLAPLLVALWSVRVKTLAALPSELPCGDHPAE